MFSPWTDSEIDGTTPIEGPVYDAPYDQNWTTGPYPFSPVSPSPYPTLSIPLTSIPSVSTHQAPGPFWDHSGQHELFMEYGRSSFHGMQALHGPTPPELRHPFLPSFSQALQPTVMSSSVLLDVPQQDKPLTPNSLKVSEPLVCAATIGASFALPDNSDLTEGNSANRLRTESARDLFRSLPNGEVKDVIGNILQSRWLLQNEMEPSIPTSQGASGAGPSTSIYTLLVSDSPVKRCKLCKYQNERFDRILAHLRSHFNHRPYACNSACGSTIW